MLVPCLALNGNAAVRSSHLPHTRRDLENEFALLYANMHRSCTPFVKHVSGIPTNIELPAMPKWCQTADVCGICTLAFVPTSRYW